MTTDRTGQIIKRLTVLGPVASYQRGTAWRCLCACGREVTIPESQMHFRASCGCARSMVLTDEGERLRLGVSHDPKTGLFRRLAGGRKRPIGSIIDDVGNHGYIRVFAGHKQYLGHRLAWWFVHGEWPAKQIDHINGIKTDNRIVNLRAAEVWQNRANSRKSDGKSSRLKGATFREDMGRWESKVRKHGVVYRLGYFDTEEEAHAAYCVKAKELFGEFARAA